MRRPNKAGGKARKRRKTLTRRRVHKAASHTTGKETNVGRLTRERDEALEQQAATSEVLNVISSSAGELQPVFQTILQNATRICEAHIGILFRYQDGAFTAVSLLGVTPAYAEYLNRGPIRPGPGTGLGRVASTRQTIHIVDTQAESAYAEAEPLRVATAKLGGARTLLNVPMLKDGELIGSIGIYRQEVRPFTNKQVELVSNFAAQAVIAIENTRLLNELRESLQQQTATADVLKVISSSPGELAPVFDAMLANATRICEAAFGNLFLREGFIFRSVAIHSKKGHVDSWRRNPATDVRDNPGNPLDRIFKTKRVVHVPDLRIDHSYIRKNDRIVTLVEAGGARTHLSVPMLKDGELVGSISMYRQEVRPFTVKQIELVQNFAAQAVIAIENTRLLSELRESLQQQTATADVLKVISRSTFDLQTVLDTLVESAAKLCDADKAYIFQLQSGIYQFAANYGFSPELLEFAKQNPIVPGRGTITGRVALEGKTVHVPDVLADPEFTGHGYQSRGNFRTTLGVPLMREGKTIGVFFLARSPVKPFTDKQIELVETFADQAVIAIENARLFDEVQARTRDLSESLEQQTATSEVLKVISSSPGDLEPVFQAILGSATQICQAGFGTLNLYEDGAYRSVALHNPPPQFAKRLGDVIHPHPDSGLAHVARTKQIAHIEDIRTQKPYLDGNEAVVGLADLGGARTLLIVPLLKESDLLGTISIYRQEVLAFDDKQIGLVKNFAAQAVIAIENTRLLNELRESLQQQTATSDVLKVISRSTFDLQTVLNTLVELAARVCEADTGIIRQRDGDTYPLAATFGLTQQQSEHFSSYSELPDRGSVFGRAILENRTIHVPDILADLEYNRPRLQEFVRVRAALGVPLVREGTVIGVFTLQRKEPRPFTEKQIELVTTFADQAVIAIENVRLFKSVEARTRELAASLENLRTTQDRLVQTQKLASLGQLTAGIAHEIKNPLNFVNNFSQVSAELIEELLSALADVNLTEKKRSEVAELMGTLQDNLGKIEQHGKRADAIVRNMLLHSREGSGEHRPVDINALVEEGLNLAYHGARAEKQGFNITVKKSFDPSAGQADVFPQDITRVLLNLISNGFYAAIKRNEQVNGGNYEPTLTASTRNLGDSIEIRIRDNGTGISEAVKDKIFNPFFTTKPAGEGTGLGLSISHDVIVKQHGGSIEVETQPGEFTEFKIILPRTAATIAKPGDHP